MGEGTDMLHVVTLISEPKVYKEGQSGVKFNVFLVIIIID